MLRSLQSLATNVVDLWITHQVSSLEFLLTNQQFLSGFNNKELLFFLLAKNSNNNPHHPGA